MLQGRSNRIVKGRAAILLTQVQRPSQLRYIVSEWNGSRKSVFHTIIEINYKEFVARVAVRCKSEPCHDHVLPFMQHAAAIIKHKANCDRRISIRKLSDRPLPPIFE